MYKHEIFLSIQDLMVVMATDRYQSALVRHQQIRDSLSTKYKKNNITIREFCEYEGFSFEEIWSILRDTPVPDFLSGLKSA